MADVLASFVLDKFGEFVKEEKDLLTGVRDEVKYVQDELEQIKALFEKAEATEETDPQSKVWIHQVRRIAFQIEDIIDEYALRLAHDRRDIYNADLCSSVFRFIECIQNVKHRHEIASKIQQIKCKITEVSKRRERYPRQNSRSTSITIKGHDRRREDALLLEDADLVGIDEPKRELVDLLNEKSTEMKVISIAGMGGLGKTTLAKQVYEKVKKDFQVHAWINVTENLKEEEILKDLINQLREQTKELTPWTIYSREIIKTILGGRKFLLVLDDVWHKKDWEYISNALPKNNLGSRIILTTRKREVATACQGEVYDLKPLPADASWNLFCKNMFSFSKEQKFSEKLIPIARGIIERCEGLPLAIVAITGYLPKDTSSGTEEWETVKSNVFLEIGSQNKHEEDKLESLKRILSLSYYDLPFYLKACLLYLCVFPKNYEIERMQLIRLWIAERFVEEMRNKTLEEVAEGYLLELVSRSLIQVAQKDKTGRIRTFRIHDIMREVILSKAKDQNFAAIISDDQGSTDHWQQEGSDDGQKEAVAARRLSIYNSLENISHGDDISTRTLLFFGVQYFPFKILSRKNLRLLTVLDIRGTNLSEFPNELLKLYHLSYLSLRDTAVTALPNSIGKLQNLETLDLKRTQVTTLPPKIKRLPNLRHLLVYVKDEFRKIRYSFQVNTASIEYLCSLQKLCFLDLNMGDANIVIEEIGKLKQLRKLGIVNFSLDHRHSLCSSIEKLNNLRTLHIQSEETISIEQVSSPPRFLERLCLWGKLEKVPDWFSSLENLTKLVLINSSLNTNLLQPIQALSKLVYLSLEGAFAGDSLCEGAFAGDSLCFEAKSFPKLKVLHIERLQNQTKVDVKKNAVPNLEELQIRYCKLKEGPSGIEYLEKLKALTLRYISQSLCDEIKKHPRLGSIQQIDIAAWSEDKTLVQDQPSELAGGPVTKKGQAMDGKIFVGGTSESQENVFSTNQLQAKEKKRLSQDQQKSKIGDWQQVLHRLDAIETYNKRISEQMDGLDARLRNLEQTQSSHNHNLG